MASAKPVEDEDDTGPGLPACYEKIPLESLRVSARKRLSLYLNLERLPNENGIVSDFNGLAEKVGFAYLDQENFARLRDPTLELLSEWTRRPDLDPTVGNLFKYLKEMERDDILTDCRQIIMTDIQHYVTQQERRQNSVVPLQDETITQSSMVDYTDHNVDEYRYMTIDDVANDSPTFYDAFICYDPEGYDLQFVKKMISELESETYGLKLFVPFRDDLPGSSTYTISARLIQQRCRRMVIILSPRFLTSPACDFQTKFAHCLSPGSRSKKLVPVLIIACAIPQILRHVTLCDFTKRDLMEWFWVRLARAIKAPLNYEELQVSTKINIDDIKITNNPEEYRRSRSNSTGSSSQPLPIIPANASQAQSTNSSQIQSTNSSANSSMDTSGSPRTLHIASSSPSSNSSSQNSSPIPPRRRHRATDRNIPQLFPSSQC